MNSQSSRSSHAPKKGKPNVFTPWSRYRHGCDPPVSHINPPHLSPNIATIIITVLLNFSLLSFTAFSAGAAEEPDTSTLANDKLIPLMIHIEQPLHFDAPDGQRVTASPGMYLVEPLTHGDPRLELWDERGRVTLQATRTTHDQRVETPEAYLIREDANEDIHHVVVFISDGTALEAIGSVSGIQTRGNVRATRRYQLDTATGVVQFGDGQQGRRLPTDQSNVSTQYRERLGSQGNELSMIELQSVISQRQMAVKLTTSLLNKLQGQFQLEEGTDRPGNDYAQHMEDSPESCRTSCARDGNCQAFTFLRPNPGLAQGQCFLKRSEPQPLANHCCVSGTRRSNEQKIIQNIGR
ncbi:MAG: PAN domain-containing protein [Nitrospirota bacterium]